MGIGQKNLLEIEKFLPSCRVLITGHTGFTGSWLLGWLNQLGSEIAGLALDPNTQPSIFEETGFEQFLAKDYRGDICDKEFVLSVFDEFDPEIVFHLAAQPIVSVGYDSPHMTFNTNVMGTLNVLEAARSAQSTRAVVCVTTDKVYENNEWVWGYRETDRLGGKDPYSASKSACEMVIKTYQDALAPVGNGVKIAAARGGNIIGGGDWADNRIVPDFVRAASSGGVLELRNPTATRPWQHVIALVHGYIELASALSGPSMKAVGSWNFGPTTDGEKSVGDLVKSLVTHWPAANVKLGNSAFQESHFLHLSSEKARADLGWNPGLNFAATVDWTANWYREFFSGVSASDLTLKQIESYRERLRQQSS